MSMRTIVYVCLLTFVVSLALLIGWQLSNQAMAVMFGVIAGVAASIPTSLIVVWATLRNPPEAPGSARPPEPQVIIIHPSGATSPGPTDEERSLTALPAYAAPQAAGYGGPATSRQFTIIGGEE
jgi:hypothetical protein